MPGDNFFFDSAPEITAIGDIVGGFGAYLQGQELEDAYKYNASILDQQANQEMVASDLDVRKIGMAEDQLLSTQKAMYAKAGVTQSGSPTDVALNSATNFEFDKQVAKYNATIASQNLQSQAANQRYYGKSAAQQGTFQMASSLLKGAAAIAFLA